MTSRDRLRRLAHSKIGELVQSTPILAPATASIYSSIQDIRRKQYLKEGKSGETILQLPGVDEVKFIEFDASYPEIRLIQKIVENIDKGSAFLDVGANVGHHSIPYAKKANVTAFEPISLNIEMLRQNIELNEGIAVDIHGVALSDESGKKTFQIQEQLYEQGSPDPRAGFKKGGTTVDISVETKKLDNIELSRVDGMKIDIEGSELKMLRGSERTLEEFHPDIYLEMHPNKMSKYGHTPEDIFNLLDGFEYTSEVLMPDDERQYIHFK